MNKNAIKEAMVKDNATMTELTLDELAAVAGGEVGAVSQAVVQSVQGYEYYSGQYGAENAAGYGNAYAMYAYDPPTFYAGGGGGTDPDGDPILC